MGFFEPTYDVTSEDMPVEVTVQADAVEPS